MWLMHCSWICQAWQVECIESRIQSNARVSFPRLDARSVPPLCPRMERHCSAMLVVAGRTPAPQVSSFWPRGCIQPDLCFFEILTLPGNAGELSPLQTCQPKSNRQGHALVQHSAMDHGIMEPSSCPEGFEAASVDVCCMFYQTRVTK